MAYSASMPPVYSPARLVYSVINKDGVEMSGGQTHLVRMDGNSSLEWVIAYLRDLRWLNLSNIYIDKEDVSVASYSEA